MQNKKFGALSSSQNPQQLAAWVQGLILSAGAFIIMGASWFGITLVDEQITDLATQGGLAVGALWTLFGAVRAVVSSFASKD